MSSGCLEEAAVGGGARAVTRIRWAQAGRGISRRARGNSRRSGRERQQAGAGGYSWSKDPGPADATLCGQNSLPGVKCTSLGRAIALPGFSKRFMTQKRPQLTFLVQSVASGVRETWFKCQFLLSIAAPVSK